MFTGFSTENFLKQLSSGFVARIKHNIVQQAVQTYQNV